MCGAFAIQSLHQVRDKIYGKITMLSKKAQYEGILMKLMQLNYESL